MDEESKILTLQKAIDMGESHPEFFVQFQYIRKALENRNKHLISQWAEITNIT